MELGQGGIISLKEKFAPRKNMDMHNVNLLISQIFSHLHSSLVGQPFAQLLDVISSYHWMFYYETV